MDGDVKVALDFSLHDVFNETSAVGGLSVENANGGATPNEEKVSNDGRKDGAIDSLLLAAALSSGPHVTRHHYHHSFFPSSEDGEATVWDWSDSDGHKLMSRQAPRSARLGHRAAFDDSSRSSSISPGFKPVDVDGNGAYSLPLVPLMISRISSVSSSETSLSSDVSELIGIDDGITNTPTVSVSRGSAAENGNDVQVKCMVRTRVPTPHGEVFLHLYHNNCDDKEHLAIVVDPAQLDSCEEERPFAPFIRSKSLDAVWHDGETPMERITRGAYVGRLSEAGYKTSYSTESDVPEARSSLSHAVVPAPLVRIHSECFTGETVGSLRCDCGEQLDEALRRIAQPISIINPENNTPTTIPGRGAVIYMRQEGRGIGLLSKLRAYNLQDLGHDTVQANLLLGHGADERGYEVAAAIMEDLGLGVDGMKGESACEGVRLLTNNPDKVTKLIDAGVHVADRVSMVPRTWQCQAEDGSQTGGYYCAGDG
ncbi:hypothetical protein EW145_g582 [Phellinidium pouzarii]|uniref:GTP cyclohydrolase II n=1 Tax=Phellinidium pouzarii TaxID=167371 RepID=A0A4S4LNC8_9AGAM|nr:hypothetical protein EW145_g582 [Phellinidium pouzarii]